MQIRDLMTKEVVRIHPEEPVSVAARAFQRYNIGVLPVCGGDGKLCGVLTDRDLVTRCLAAGRNPQNTPVRDIMTRQVITAPPDMDAGRAASMMGSAQVRRLLVLENGRLCGMVSLGDLALREETGYDAGDALAEISTNLRENG